jgi:hypothetical protein
MRIKQEIDIEALSSRLYPFGNAERNAFISGYNKTKEIYEYKSKLEDMTNSKQLSLIDALCIIKTGSRTEQERELLDHAYLVIKQHSEVLHLQYQKQCIDEKLTKIKKDDKE